MKPLTYNIDLRDWLDKEAERQQVQHGKKNHALISAAAEATERFSDDELEEFARRRS
jgi:hypothetical protein